MIQNIEQAIIDHAKKELSIPENKISIIRTPISELPQNMDVYYLEVDGSYGNVYYYYFVLNNDQLFCSGEKDSFGRLLKAERYLERKHLSAEQLMILFRMLKVPQRDTHTIHSSDLAEDDELKPYLDQLSAPSKQQSQSGVDIVFWTTSLHNPLPEKWTVSVLPNYRVDYRSQHIVPKTQPPLP